MSEATWSAASWARSKTTTRIPRPARCRHVAAPRPPAPPVTMATRSFSSMGGIVAHRSRTLRQRKSRYRAASSEAGRSVALTTPDGARRGRRRYRRCATGGG